MLGRSMSGVAPRFMQDSRVRSLVLVSATQAGSVMFCKYNNTPFRHHIANMDLLIQRGYMTHRGLVPFKNSHGQPVFLTKEDISNESWGGFLCPKAMAMLQHFDSLRCEDEQNDRLEELRRDGLVSPEARLGGGKLGRLMQVCFVHLAKDTFVFSAPYTRVR